MSYQKGGFNLVDTKGNKQRAVFTLGISLRQVNRLIKGYKEFGKAFFSHGNKGRKPVKDMLTAKMFKTLQTRLPVELRLAGITELNAANKFLDSYLQKFNAKFALPIDNTKSVFEIQPSTESRYIIARAQELC